MAIVSDARPALDAVQRELPAFEIDPDREQRCEASLRDFLTRRGQHPVEPNVQQLIGLNGGFIDRFNYFVPRIPPEAFRKLLISGSAAGSEMIVARHYGFQRVCGTEIRREYVEITQERLANGVGFEAVYYQGAKLPYADGAFSMIISGHIIEHTPSPYKYFHEHMRVLEPGGWFFLEFPDRYHPVELHTQLPSMEYLPLPWRSIALRYYASRFGGLPTAMRRRYDLIRRTLKPVSERQIERYLARMGCRDARIMDRYNPAPGFVRMLIRK